MGTDICAKQAHIGPETFAISRLTIDISPEQHKSLKAMAALEGKTIRQYALERLFPHSLRFVEDEACDQVLREGRRVIPLDDLPHRPEAQMDEEERAARRNLRVLLAERAAKADAGRFADRTLEDIRGKPLREEGFVAE